MCIWVPGHLFKENAFFFEEGSKGHPKPLGSFQLHEELEIWPPEAPILLENMDQKNAISLDFWHFSNFDVFLKGEPKGIQTSKRDLPNSCGIWDVAARSFNFIGKHKGEPNKNRDFL